MLPLKFGTIGTLGLLLACPTAIAQSRLLIVDASQGAGSHFADLPPAVAAAVTGDRISVRPGTYSAFTIDGKGIAVAGAPGVTVPAVTILRVPAGTDCAVSGLTIVSWFSGELRVADCAGRVLLSDLSLGMANTGIVALSRCAQLMLSGCVFGSTTRLDTCTATLCDSTFGGMPLIGTAAPGLELVASRTFMSRCRATAGLYLDGGAPGVLLRGGALTITDDGTNVIAARATGHTTAQSAIEGTGAVTLDPRVVLQPVGAAPPIANGVQVIVANVPSLSARTGPIGGRATMHLQARAFDDFALIAGLPGDLVSVPPFGEVWVSLPTAVVAAAGALDASGTLTIALPVPNATILVGVRITWQAVAGPPGGLRMSNAAGYVHWL